MSVPGGVDLPTDLGVHLANLISFSPLDVSSRGVDLLADLGVDLPNLNSFSPLDVSTAGNRSAGRSAKFELNLHH